MGGGISEWAAGISSIAREAGEIFKRVAGNAVQRIATRGWPMDARWIWI